MGYRYSGSSGSSLNQSRRPGWTAAAAAVLLLLQLVLEVSSTPFSAAETAPDVEAATVAPAVEDGKSNTNSTSEATFTTDGFNYPYLCNFSSYYIEKWSTSLDKGNNDNSVALLLQLSTDGTTLIVRGPPVVRVYDLVLNTSTYLNSDENDYVEMDTSYWLQRQLPPYQDHAKNANETNSANDNGGNTWPPTTTYEYAVMDDVSPMLSLATLSGGGGLRKHQNGNRIVAVVKNAAINSSSATNVLLSEMTYDETNDSWTAQSIQTTDGLTNNANATILAWNGNDDDILALEVSADGTVLALHEATSGMIQVYRRNGNDDIGSTGSVWTPMGKSLLGPTTSSTDTVNGKSAQHLSLSANGTILAIGNSTAASVTIYKFEATMGSDGQRYSGGMWTPYGQSITSGPYFGHAVSLSANGTIIAIGAAYPVAAGNLQTGQVEVHEYTTTTTTTTTSNGETTVSSSGTQGIWSRMGNSISGTSVGANFGYSVALSADGLVLVVGASGTNQANDPASSVTTGSGGVYVYLWYPDWQQWQADTSGNFNNGQVGYARSTNSVALSANGRTVAHDASTYVQIVRYDLCTSSLSPDTGVAFSETQSPSYDDTSINTAPPSSTFNPINVADNETVTPLDDDLSTTLPPSTFSDDETGMGEDGASVPPIYTDDTMPWTESDFLLAATVNLTGLGRIERADDVLALQGLMADFFDQFFVDAATSNSSSNNSGDEDKRLVSGVTYMSSIILVTGQEVFDNDAIQSNRITYLQTTSYATVRATAVMEPTVLIQLPFVERESKDKFVRLLQSSSIAVLMPIQDIGLPVPTNAQFMDTSAQRGTDIDDNDDEDKKHYVNTLVGVSVGAFLAVVIVSTLFWKSKIWKPLQREDAPTVHGPNNAVPLGSVDAGPWSGAGANENEAIPRNVVPADAATTDGGAISAAAATVRLRLPLEPMAPISRIMYVASSSPDGELDDDVSSVSRLATEAGSLAKPRLSPVSGGGQRSLSSSRSALPQFATAVIQLEPEGSRSVIEYHDVLIAVAAPPLDEQLQPDYKDQVRQTSQSASGNSSTQTTLETASTTTVVATAIVPSPPTTPTPINVPDRENNIDAAIDGGRGNVEPAPIEADNA